MVFSSLIFLYLFLPLLLATYFLARSIAYRNWVLIVFSFVFYAWGEPVWVLLLLGCAFVGYGFALLIERYRGTRLAKLLFVISITLNIGILCYFKYTGFLLDNLGTWLHVSIPYHDVGLPIGISFFTFEIICYTADVYKGTIKAPKSPTQMLLYVSFFPHLVAGPIIRFTDIEEQIRHRVFSLSQFSDGINRFMIGLGKKVLIANSLGESVSAVMDGGGGGASVLGAWFGITLFALQIYFDFSGYSDMAIGLGKMFGITLRENFNYPYISRSASDFWRRWNISLGGFFRDYVYIPLGGNKRMYLRNLFVVWFLTGFWHGASWNFIIWGLYFGLLIYLERAFLDRVFRALPVWVSHLYLLVAMLVGWVWFYFTDLSAGVRHLGQMFGFAGVPWSSVELGIFFRDNAVIFAIGIVFSTPVFGWLAGQLSERFGMRRFVDGAKGLAPLRNLVLLAAATALLVGSTYNPFLYFRF
ncbi:MBOAT family O-acyltransferase [Paenibacillus koleovorans]|uniref:MBOAT family O-acyltransferase n=1 Tax=Paenibacillus koleovorans TaxID=121608 RepID=UPI000FDC34E3|nr:MBOAT family O-acyltransferase [Paenibacillus koleovorans]